LYFLLLQMDSWRKWILWRIGWARSHGVGHGSLGWMGIFKSWSPEEACLFCDHVSNTSLVRNQAIFCIIKYWRKHLYYMHVEQKPIFGGWARLTLLCILRTYSRIILMVIIHLNRVSLDNPMQILWFRTYLL